MVVNISIVEDDEHICELMNIALEGHQGRVSTYHTCSDALNSMSTIQTSLWILDIGLPDGDGIDLANKIHQKEGGKTTPTPVIFLTARSDMASRFDAYQAYALDYITKPFSVREFRLKLFNIIELLSANMGAQVSPHNRELTNTPNKQSELMYSLMDLCQSNSSDHTFGIEDAAHHLGLSVRTLQRRLLTHFNTTFTEIMTKVRMEKARAYLSKDYKPKEVARLCGYLHVENFSGAFFKHNEISPAEYRKLHATKQKVN